MIVEYSADNVLLSTEEATKLKSLTEESCSTQAQLEETKPPWTTTCTADAEAALANMEVSLSKTSNQETIQDTTNQEGEYEKASAGLMPIQQS